MMKKTIVFAVFTAALIMGLPAVSAEKVETNSHRITINTGEEDIEVVESLTLDLDIAENETLRNIDFWIQNGATDIKMEIANYDYESSKSFSNNIHSYNVTSLNITSTQKLNAKITYHLDQKTEKLHKKILYNTKNLTVTLNGKQIYEGKDLDENSYVELTLYEPAETPLTWYIIAFIVLLVILLAVSILYSYKQQKAKKTRITGVSKELLTTQKKLLTDLLKDIEKKHRNEKISDDTYHKLKEKYKQDAVVTMKRLEELESEVK
ncbi:MAG: hypothetical protein V5A64_06740 [Candidatus Thermoplasmatota archaeon]